MNDRSSETTECLSKEELKAKMEVISHLEQCECTENGSDAVCHRRVAVIDAVLVLDGE